jgi:outer membrane immunogenic protein
LRSHHGIYRTHDLRKIILFKGFCQVSGNFGGIVSEIDGVYFVRRRHFVSFPRASFAADCGYSVTAFSANPRMVSSSVSKPPGVFNMKKIVVALSALAAFTGSAIAADMAPRSYSKAAPMPVAMTSWTGCYVGGGGGGAYVKNDHNDFSNSLALTGFAPGTALGPNLSSGADGWFGTVQVGCDYQFMGNWVAGVFADYDFMDVRGDTSVFGTFAPSVVGSQKMDSQWAVGGRVGYLVLPQLLTYISGGYTQGHWKSTNLTPFAGLVPTASLPGSTKGGWFIGTGDEYALSFLPGLFWKTEYRYAEFDRANVAISTLPAGLATGTSSTERFHEHSVRSELVYRFNWGGPVVAKY